MHYGNAIRRALRGLLQITFVQAGIQLYNAFSATQLTVEQVTAITVFATPVLSFLQNFLEDNDIIPAIAKDPPPSS